MFRVSNDRFKLRTLFYTLYYIHSHINMMLMQCFSKRLYSVTPRVLQTNLQPTASRISPITIPPTHKSLVSVWDVHSSRIRCPILKWLYETLHECKWKSFQLQSCRYHRDLQLWLWSFLHPRSFENFEFQMWEIQT